MVGFSWNVGHGLTYKVLMADTRKIICRSWLPLTSDAENKVEEAHHMQPRKQCFFLGSKHEMDDPNARLPTLEAFDCPFVSNDDDVPNDTVGTNASSDRGGSDQEDRGDNNPSHRGATPVIADQDIQDGLL